MSNVSIIIRTSKRYIFLERALMDLKKQSYENWKAIIVNDGGDFERIQRIIKDSMICEEKIHLVNLEKNIGLNKTINIGAKLADSEFVTVHDDDDTWNKEFLSKTANYLTQNPKVKGLITHSNLMKEKVLKNGKIKVCGCKDYNSNLQGVISINEILKNNLFPPISFIYRREVYSDIGYFNENLKVLEDWDFNIRFLMKYDIFILEERLANYHIRVNQNILKEFKNTVTNRKKTHKIYDTIIRNDYLRQDLKNERIGIGVMMNLIKWNDNRVIRLIKKILKR